MCCPSVGKSRNQSCYYEWALRRGKSHRLLQISICSSPRAPSLLIRKESAVVSSLRLVSKVEPGRVHGVRRCTLCTSAGIFLTFFRSQLFLSSRRDQSETTQWNPCQHRAGPPCRGFEQVREDNSLESSWYNWFGIRQSSLDWCRHHPWDALLHRQTKACEISGSLVSEPTSCFRSFE